MEGKGPLIQENKSATLSYNNDQTLFVPVAYAISSDQSNAMLSSNPHSGIYEANTARCLDANGGNPACNQGGMAIVCVEGNESRPSHKGDGYSETDVMYTLNATEVHGVAFWMDRASFNQGENAKFDFQIEENLSPTLVATGPNAVCCEAYTASKASFFTKTNFECLRHIDGYRLQGSSNYRNA